MEGESITVCFNTTVLCTVVELIQTTVLYSSSNTRDCAVLHCTTVLYLPVNLFALTVTVLYSNVLYYCTVVLREKLYSVMMIDCAYSREYVHVGSPRNVK